MYLTLSPLLKMQLNLHNQVPATSEKNDKPTKATPLRVSLNGKVTLNIDTLLPSGLKLTDGAPQRWILKLPGEALICVCSIRFHPSVPC